MRLMMSLKLTKLRAARNKTSMTTFCKTSAWKTCLRQCSRHSSSYNNFNAPNNNLASRVKDHQERIANNIWRPQSDLNKLSTQIASSDNNLNANQDADCNSNLKLVDFDVEHHKDVGTSETCIEGIPTSSSQDKSEKSQAHFNAIGIRMISSHLHKHIFPSSDSNGSTSRDLINSKLDQTKIDSINNHLIAHSLKAKNDKRKILKTKVKEVEIENDLPKLLGKNLAEHYKVLGEKYSSKYKELVTQMIQSNMPTMPHNWQFKEGWTRYCMKDGIMTTESVQYPLEDVLVFDVEVCMKDSNGTAPTLATAVSPIAWYSWCSKKLFSFNNSIYFNQLGFHKKTTVKDLIPMGVSNEREKLIIGHNVSFDRSYISDQYGIDVDKTRFLDTLSLHMCVSGLTQHQRALAFSKKSKDGDEVEKIEECDSKESVSSAFGQEISADLWDGIGCLNNLVDVHKLYCDKQTISKDSRQIFIKGSLQDVVDNFQDLMLYCANDVVATLQILCKVFPLYNERFPHAVTLAGMLELSVMYLPVLVNNWERYINEAQLIYEEKERELNLSLREIANKTCSLLKEKEYCNDVWLWDLDWSTPKMRFKIEKPLSKKLLTQRDVQLKELESQCTIKETSLWTDNVIKTFFTSSRMMKIQPILPGYPRWYTEFCVRTPLEDKLELLGDVEDWESGPFMISTAMRSVPKLMRLMWNGFPLHYDEKYGWGYLKPDPEYLAQNEFVVGGVDDKKNVIYFPIQQLKNIVAERGMNDNDVELNSHDVFNNFDPDLQEAEQSRPISDVIEGCLFFKLPHKGGPSKRVGNPLGKDFLKKVEDGTMTAYKSDIASFVLNQSKVISYWKNASKRINSQMVLSPLNDQQGAILPRVIVAGTVTRRAVEPTWLTASNAYEDRLGSELKGIIQCPDGYNFVGADVDSQELWIASLLGDANFHGLHGCTGISWMTLQGSKSEGTDMHSKVASSINISRDQAKVLNYARIYGSGPTFAGRFLMQSNPGLSSKEAKDKAKKIFTETKGVRKRLFTNDVLKKSGKEKMKQNVKSAGENNEEKREQSDDFKSRRFWSGGTESHMFNKLEEIAMSPEPRTPFLGCRISRALEPSVVKENYITSRVNWVVQSSAVDFLHLILVTMKWLMEEKKIEGRFAISIHDELRYLIKSEDKYEAAMALQISNLLTRAFFSHQLGMNDLPHSVAFFSSIEVDKCLRKEVNMDCKSPSNPLGLRLGYNVPFGESLDIYQLLKKLKTN